MEQDINMLRIGIVLKVLMLVLLIIIVTGLTVNAVQSTQTTKERISPHDIIAESQIVNTRQTVTIHDKNLSLTRYTDTNSMDPVLDNTSTGIERIGVSIEEIEVGDIITFFYMGQNIAHRVIEKGVDEQGIFVKTKGDNVPIVDGIKIRQEQIKGVLVGIIY